MSTRSMVSTSSIDPPHQPSSQRWPERTTFACSGHLIHVDNSYHRCKHEICLAHRKGPCRQGTTMTLASTNAHMNDHTHDRHCKHWKPWPPRGPPCPPQLLPPRCLSQCLTVSLEEANTASSPSPWKTWHLTVSTFTSHANHQCLSRRQSCTHLIYIQFY